MSRSVIASSAATHPPLSGIDEVSIPRNALLKFTHPALDPLYIHSGASAIKWAYHLNTMATPTVGGEVIQVLSALTGPITITGNTAGLKTNASGKINTTTEVKGWRDVGDRKAYTPNDELREITAWFRNYMTRAGSLVAGQQLRNEAAILFTYPERGWQFYIQVTKLDGFRYDMETISPEWSITAEIVSDNALDYFGGVTMASFTDDLITNNQLLGQMGLSKFATSGTEISNPNFGQDGDAGSGNPFLNPSLSASGITAAKKMGDNFKGLVAAWATGDFAHFGFGALIDNGFNKAQVDATYQQLFGTTFSGSTPGAGSETSGTTVYGGPTNPTTKDQIVLDIVTSFEANQIPGKVGVAVAMNESGLNPDRTQDGCTSANCGIGLFQTNGDGSGAAGGVSAASKAAVVRAGNVRVYGSQQGNIIGNYPSGMQISDAASWFSATQKRDYPSGLMGASDETLAEFAQRAQGAGDPAYVAKILSLLPQATALIKAATAANVAGGAASGVRLSVVNWAYKLVATNPQPTYSEGCRRDVENVTPGDWGAVRTMDCSMSIALLYAWGTSNNHKFALNNGTFNGTSTRTIWSTWGTKVIPIQQARAGDIIVFGTTAENSYHAEMFVGAYNGDNTLTFSFGSNPPTIAPFANLKTGPDYKVFSILP